MLVFRVGSMLKVKSQKIGTVSDTLGNRENISKIYKSSLMWIKEKKKEKELRWSNFRIWSLSRTIT